MVIAPGDLVVGDYDGLLCVGYDDIAAVYAAAKAKNDAEVAQMAAIQAGTSDRAGSMRA
jgi:regulator of RNase E activity RraA